MKRRRKVIGLALMAFLGVPFIVPLFSPWSRINCREFELDLVSGQQRVTRYLYGIPVHRELRETAASDALGAEVSDVDEAQWVRTSTFGPFTRHSPHYVYHSASHQVKMLELVWDEFGYDADGRRETAQELLSRFRSTGSDSVGDDYIQELTKIGEQAVVGNPAIRSESDFDHD